MKLRNVTCNMCRQFFPLQRVVFLYRCNNIRPLRRMLLYWFKGLLHPRLVFGLFLHFSQKLQHIGNKYSLNVNEWKFHSPIEWNSCKPLKKEWFCTLNSKFPLIKSENHSKKSELPLIWGVKRRTTRKRIVLRLTPQTSGNSLFLESFSLYMSGNLLFNVQNHSFLSGLQEFHSFGEWNFHSFTFRE